MNLRLGNALRSAADKALQSRATDHFLAPGEEVSLNRSVDAGMGALVLRGFAAPEDDGIWSAAAECRVDIRMRAVRADRRYRVVITAIPFETAGHRALVAISVNGGPAHQIMGKGSGWLQVEVDGQLGMVGRSPGISLEFQIANPMSPNALNMGDDHRLLGFKLGSIRVVDIGKAAHPSAVVTADEPVEVLPPAPLPDVLPVATPAPALVSEEAHMRSPGEVIHALANRGPLWRKILLDRNPLVRVVRWMRRVSVSLQSVEHQLDQIRLDSARQTRELARRVSEIEVDARESDAKHTRERSNFESLMEQLQLNHDRLIAIEQSAQEAQGLQVQHRELHAGDLSAIVDSTSNLARNYDQVLKTLVQKQQAQQAMVTAFEAVDARMQSIEDRITQLRTEHEHRFGMGVGELSARQADLLELLVAVDKRWNESHATLERSLSEAITLAGERHQDLRDDPRLAKVGDLLSALEERQQCIGDAVREQVSTLSGRIDQLGTLSTLAARLAEPAEDAQVLRDLLTAAHEKLDSTGIAAGQLLGMVSANRDRLDSQAMRMETLPNQLAAAVSGLVSQQSRRVLRTHNGWLIATSFGHISCDEKDDMLAMCLAEWGDVERGLRLFLQRNLMPGDVFVDVGANVGLHTVVAASRVGGQGRVHAIEAMPRTVEHLRASVRLSGVEEQVQVHPVAAGARDIDGQVFNIAAIAGHSSLYPLQEEVVEQVTVPVRTLDGMLPRVDVRLVKIDVEGAELDAIQGMAQLIARQPRLGIVAEYAISHLTRVGTTPDDWERMRRTHGFDLYLIDDLSGRCDRLSGFDELNERVSSNVLLCRPESGFVLVDAEEASR